MSLGEVLGGFGCEFLNQGRERSALSGWIVGERHAVTQRGFRQRLDIVERRSKTSAQQRARTRGEHERLTCARARAPVHPLLHLRVVRLFRTRRAYETYDRL